MVRNVVIVVDLQNDYFPDGKLPLWNVEAARDKVVRIIAAARQGGTPVIHVRHEFTDARASFFVAGTEGARFHETVQPADGEEIVLKHYPNAFRETRLHEILSAHAPEEIVIAGAMSHMCIDATARAAADLGYKIVVLHDACATRDVTFGGQTIAASHVHAAFMAALASSYARLLSVEEYIAVTA